LDLNQILSYCKNKEVSLTVYLATVYLWSIYKSENLQKTQHKPIQIAVPVNLRRFFDTNTTMNFFSYIKAGCYASNEELNFDQLLLEVKEQFVKQISKERFSSKIASDVAIRHHVLVRILPLAIKNVVIKSVYMASLRAYTSTMSNIGQIVIPPLYKDDIEHFEFLLNPTITDPIKVGICSYNNKLLVTFSSQLVKTHVQKEFFRKLSSDGMIVNIESNGVYYENL
jgi:NRPS condensation-like uncharacterized protein